MKTSLILADPKRVGVGGGSNLEPGSGELENHFKAMKSFPQLLCRELTVTEHFVGGRGDKEL